MKILRIFCYLNQDKWVYLKDESLTVANNQLNVVQNTWILMFFKIVINQNVFRVNKLPFKRSTCLVHNKPNLWHITEHAIVQNHKINWNGGKIIKTAINDFQRKNYESIAIRTADENLLLIKLKENYYLIRGIIL